MTVFVTPITAPPPNGALFDALAADVPMFTPHLPVTK